MPSDKIEELKLSASIYEMIRKINELVEAWNKWDEYQRKLLE